MMKNEWTLLALQLAGDKGLTPAQLQKVLFLIKQNYSSKLGNFYEFKPYNYGPFDKQIYVDAEALAEQGLVVLKKQPGHSWSTYQISPEFDSEEHDFDGDIDANIVNYLKSVIEWAQKLTFQQLIASIYNKYPEYKVNSVFRG